MRPDAPFRHASLKHRVTAWVSQNVFDRVSYRARRGLLKGMKRRGGLGFLPPWLVAEDQSPERTFFEQLDVAGRCVYDVGAFHGLMTLFFARQAVHVVAYEPNPKNRERLSENIGLNGLENVTLRPKGVGSVAASTQMTWDALTPGMAKVQSNGSEGQDSGHTTTIEIVTLDDDIAEQQLPAPDFIKVDTEGFELEVLRGAGRTLAKHAPELFLEMHGETLNEKRRKVSEIVEFLFDAGYREILHVESGQAINPQNAAELANQGHLFCKRSVG